MSEEALSQLEARIQALGGECLEEIRGQRLGLMDPRNYTGKLMNWATKDPEFRVALFRFVDVLPSLKSSASIIRHAQAYFKPVAHRIPGLLQWGLDLPPDGIPAKAAASLIKRQVASLGEQFIIGSTPRKALRQLKKIQGRGMCSTVDLLGEACVSEKEAEIYLDRYIELIDALHGEVPVNISVKLSALYSKTQPVAFAASVAKLRSRLRLIYQKAMEVDAVVYVDMEDTSKTDMVLEVVRSLLMEDAFREWGGAGLVLQSYLRRTPADLERILDWAGQRGQRLAIRLVKGAYWDTETILARLANWPIPVWQEKAMSDVVYEDLSQTLLSRTDIVRPAFASHNLRSLVHAIVTAESLGVGMEDYEFQTLYGMADPIKSVFQKRGLTVREYAPVGDLLTGMAYLVRRLLENTANEGFIRSGFLENASAEVLLAKPVQKEPDTGREHIQEEFTKEFQNVPLLDFTIPDNRERIQEEIDRLLYRRSGDFPRVLPVINGQPVKDCREYMGSDCPEEPDMQLGTVGMADMEHLERALDVLEEGFPKWRATSPEARAAVLFKAADRMQRMRHDLAALIILESGKPWAEADADVAEAIDFCRYYALGALELFQTQSLCPLDGEEDHLFHEPRGICGVIAPWNFPLAISCGMMAAALVTGNPVILKPAEQSPLIAARLFEIFRESGLPDTAAAFLPGRGESIGSALVCSQKVDTIVFTGSRDVGFSILEKGSVMRSGQVHVKRLIAEMGGKNAILVDEGADLDQAVKGILHSAFGYAGQKCSACSRLYVHEAVHGPLMDRLIPAVKSLVCGRASDPSVDLGPVIDEDAIQRIRRAVETAGQESVRGLLADGIPLGRYIPATLFPDLPEDHPLMQEELFGPVLGTVKVDSFKKGIELANRSEYGLTGGVFSRYPENLDRAVRDFQVGNLYLNRGCTGALVGRQPFGGARHSGVGSKTGGPDYLKQFVYPRAVSENTLRQGFAPMGMK